MLLDNRKQHCSISLLDDLHISQCWLVAAVNCSKHPDVFARGMATVCFYFVGEERLIDLNDYSRITKNNRI